MYHVQYNMVTLLYSIVWTLFRQQRSTYTYM